MNEKMKKEEHPVFNDEKQIGHPRMNNDFDPLRTVSVGFGWLAAVAIILFIVFGILLDWAPLPLQRVFVELMIACGFGIGIFIGGMGFLILCDYIGVFFLKLWES